MSSVGSSSQAGRAAFLLDLVVRAAAHGTEVGHGGRHHHGVARTRSATRPAADISAAVSTRTTSTPCGGSSDTGPATSVTVGAAAGGLLGDREAHPPRRAVARRTEPRRSARASGPRSRARWLPPGPRDRARRRPPPRSPPARPSAPRPRRRRRADRTPGRRSTAPRARRVARCSWVLGCSHIPVCIAGAITSGPVASSSVEVTRSSASPSASFAMTLAVAGATTAPAASMREPDVQHRLGALEDVRVDGAAGQGGEGVGADEPRRRRRHDRLDVEPRVAEPPRERQRLVGRDPAGDGQEDQRTSFRGDAGRTARWARLAAGLFPAHGGPTWLPASRAART